MEVISLRAWVYFAGLSFVVVFGLQAWFIYTDATDRGVPRSVSGLLGIATVVLPYITLPVYIFQYGEINGGHTLGFGSQLILCLSISLIVASIVSPFLFPEQVNSLRVQGIAFVSLVLPVYGVLFRFLEFSFEQPRA
jgi:hypothetical protein